MRKFLVLLLLPLVAACSPSTLSTPAAAAPESTMTPASPAPAFEQPPATAQPSGTPSDTPSPSDTLTASPSGTPPSAPADPSTTPFTNNSVSADGAGVTSAFNTYAIAINHGDGSTAYSVLSSASQRLTSFTSFATGARSSRIVSGQVISADRSGRGRDAVEVEFTSVQDPITGGTGQSCSDWRMAYTMIPSGGTWRIDSAKPHAGSPVNCGEADAGEAGTGAPGVQVVANCEEMHVTHPHGVGRAGAVDNVRGNTAPVKTFLVSTEIYDANSSLDADGDGIACEKK